MKFKRKEYYKFKTGDRVTILSGTGIGLDATISNRYYDIYDYVERSLNFDKVTLRNIKLETLLS